MSVLQQQLPTQPLSRIIDSRHPQFRANFLDWQKWRLTYQGGFDFKRRYLRRFTDHEDPRDFQIRFDLSPIPTFAKSAINKIRNSIFQRMRDIARTGGSDAYRQAIAGNDLGVDRRGSSMNAFLGVKVLADLLVMGRCGIYVDNSVIQSSLAQPSLADAKGANPYLYMYQVEDILSWKHASPDRPSEFKSVLLRDSSVNYDSTTMLPIDEFDRYRLMWLNDDGQVMLQFYNATGQKVDRDGLPSAVPYALELNRIPFVMLDLQDSIIKDVCDYQIALLNLASRDVWYALQSNFPIMAMQKDLRTTGGHLKNFATADGTATTGGQPAAVADVQVGPQHGIAYDKGVNPPVFINPSSEPTTLSMSLQAKYEDDIYRLINLAVTSLTPNNATSGDNTGLEAGLSFIGLVLESAERQIAEFWSAYENKKPSSREIATIKYPDRYSLKTDMDRIEESNELRTLMTSLPGRTVKREIQKSIADTLLGGKVSVDTIEKIKREIDSSTYLSSDPDMIIAAHQDGLVGDQTASMALGFDDDEYKKGQQDQGDKATRVLKAQMAATPGDNGAPGGSLPGAPAGSQDTNPAGANNPDPNAARQQRKAATDPAVQTSNKKPDRGNAKNQRTGGK